MEFEKDSKDSVKTPKFDNSVAYLTTIDILINRAYTFSLNQDLVNWKNTLCLLFIELEPRMSPDMVKIAENLQKSIDVVFMNKTKKNFIHTGNPTNSIFKFHRHLNISAHKLGLRMSDKENKYDAADM